VCVCVCATLVKDGRSRTVATNFAQYNLQPLLGGLVIMDHTQSAWHNAVFDTIVTDRMECSVSLLPISCTHLLLTIICDGGGLAPYGVRAGARKLGRRADKVVKPVPAELYVLTHALSTTLSCFGLTWLRSSDKRSTYRQESYMSSKRFWRIYFAFLPRHCVSEAGSCSGFQPLRGKH
jgi:hypothetical protein